LLVSDVASNAILTFSATANGSVAPTQTLSGASTNLNQPEGFFVDTVHSTIWVGNYSSGTAGTITEYPLPASGNTAPMTTLGGGSTTLKGPGGIYVNASGSIYVADYKNASVDVFSASTTTQAPTQQITGAATDLVDPAGLWLDKSGNIWVANGDGTSSVAVLEFAPGATGNVAPINTLTLPTTGYLIGIFIDASQNVWVTDADNGIIYEYPSGATSATSPTRTISGATTGLSEPNGIYVDKAGYIYVANYTSATVEVFAPSANGNVAPVQTIPANATTTLAKPIGVIAY
jgi:sugar lactone lactonase YvrE